MVVAVLGLVPAGFLSLLLLFSACFAVAGGTGRPSPREQVCGGWDGNALLVCLVAVVVMGLGALVVAVRRGARGPRVWLLASLPSLGVVLVALLVGLLPPT